MLEAEGLKGLSSSDSNDTKTPSSAPKESGEAGSGSLMWSLIAFLILGLIILVG